MDNYEKLTEVLLDKFAASTTEIEKKKACEIVETIMKEGLAASREKLGLNKDALNFVYSQGFRLFKAGKIDSAELIFRYLTQIDDMDPDYPFALACTYFKKEDWQSALKAFMRAAFLNQNEPATWFEIGLCYEKLGDVENAYTSFYFVSFFAKHHPGTHPELLEQAKMLSSSMLEKLLEKRQAIKV